MDNFNLSGLLKQAVKPTSAVAGGIQDGCPRPIIGQYSLKVACVECSLQGYTSLIIRNAFAQQYTE